MGLFSLAFTARVTLTSLDWMGRVFPGFLLIDNRVVGLIRLGHWPYVPGLYLSEVVAIDGSPVPSARAAYATVAALPPGTSVQYRIRRGTVEREVVVPTARFTSRDWGLFFGPLLLNGAALLAGAIGLWWRRPTNAAARAGFAVMGSIGLACLGLADLYGPATLSRLYLVAEPLVPATLLHGALVIPDQRRLSRWRFAGYLPSAALAVAYQLYFYRPSVYARLLTMSMFYVGGMIVLSVGCIVGRSWHPLQLVRMHARVVAVGGLIAGAPFAAIVLYWALHSNAAAVNGGLLTPLGLLPFFIYLLLKQDLFDMGAMVTRAIYYALITGAVTAGYFLVVAVLNFALRARMTESVAFPVLFTCTVLLLLDPLRQRGRAFIDRFFFGATYEGAQILARSGGALVTALTRDHISPLLHAAVGEAVPNVRTRVFLEARPRSGRLDEVGGTESLPSSLVPLLTAGRIVTTFDPPAAYADPPSQEAAAAALAALGAEVAVPITIGDTLAGALTAGRKRSGRYYTARDVDFLSALAQQAAIALQNARSYEALVELNAHLERRVSERTADLERAGREIADAYAALKRTELQLVQAEKMASLGQVVAGVAHEINNPVSFIVGNLQPLRDRLARLRAEIEGRDIPGIDDLIDRVERGFEIIARGAERTAAIVQDLRTFSRLGDAELRPVDVHDALEVTLRLLHPRWNGRIVIHRAYGPVPVLQGAAGQLNQVFMNLLANACDAIATQGNIWIRTSCEGGSIAIAVRDDGAGIPPEHVHRVFEPFFTTKPQGKGTGLGLAIAHGVVASHGGAIHVTSAVGRGTEFRVVLPVGGPNVEPAASRADVH
jgi:signal transduction histidine kinase